VKCLFHRFLAKQAKNTETLQRNISLLLRFKSLVFRFGPAWFRFCSAYFPDEVRRDTAAGGQCCANRPQSFGMFQGGCRNDSGLRVSGCYFGQGNHNFSFWRRGAGGGLVIGLTIGWGAGITRKERRDDSVWGGGCREGPRRGGVKPVSTDGVQAELGRKVAFPSWSLGRGREGVNLFRGQLVSTGGAKAGAWAGSGRSQAGAWERGG
jgi:hypothetical protein